MLAFLFAIIYCARRKYQSEVKVVKSFDKKIAESIYYFFIATYSHSYTNINDRYVYIDPPTMV